ncbi:type II toxin-antitoxin system HicA family toxin [Halomonas korlensis]|uniref:type II toxin-antitoxin system HicA family toxin n=1 Tax=Halomonas korlensis TaxID=463301 RepID=UPI000A6365A7|nr:type II toxin-antitoxin system HicA family toxin [Halomonas korlensis]
MAPTIKLDGASAEVAQEEGISAATLYNWRKKARQAGLLPRAVPAVGHVGKGQAGLRIGEYPFFRLAPPGDFTGTSSLLIGSVHTYAAAEAPSIAFRRWGDIESLFKALGAEVEEREGSRVAVLFGEARVFHRPHPSPDTDKGAVASIRKGLDENGVTP